MSKRRDQLLKALVLFSRHVDRNSHPAAGLDALHRTIHLHGPIIECQARGKACPNPKCVGGLDEHATCADVAGVCAQNRRSPFNLKLGPKGITLRPPTLQAPRPMLHARHRPEPTPCQGFPHCRCDAFFPLALKARIPLLRFETHPFQRSLLRSRNPTITVVTQLLTRRGDLTLTGLCTQPEVDESGSPVGSVLATDFSPLPTLC